MYMLFEEFSNSKASETNFVSFASPIRADAPPLLCNGPYFAKAESCVCDLQVPKTTECLLVTADAPLKFLVVDDNLINIVILTNALKRAFKNCTIDTTAYPAEVLRRAFIANGAKIYSEDSSVKVNEDFNYDVMFFDIEMPLITGVQLARRLRKCCEFDEVPIVAVTSRFTDEDKRLHEQVGIDFTIGKPVPSSRKELYSIVDSVLHSRRVISRFSILS